MAVNRLFLCVVVALSVCALTTQGMTVTLSSGESVKLDAEALTKLKSLPIVGSHDFLSHPLKLTPLEEAKEAREYWFKQDLDHFEANDARTFYQRYFVYEPEFVSPHGPIFLYIGGREAINAVPKDDFRTLARLFGATLVVLEHRFYGKSQPFHAWTTENLRYLTTEQVLADVAEFRDYFQMGMNLRHGFPKYNTHPWIALGLSYGGSLASWFRLKYPHLVSGAIASSAPVHAILDFRSWDKGVQHSVGSECAAALSDGIKGAQALLDSHIDRFHVKDLFGAKDLEDDDFLLLLADVTSIPVQYGRAHELCVAAVSASRNKKSVINALAEFHKKFFTPQYNPTGPAHYAIKKLQDTTVDKDHSGRQWFFQQCTELGWFATAPQDGSSIRPTHMDLKFYHARCARVFGQPLWPDVDEVNRLFGGDQIKASNIFFTHGSQDPWMHAGVVVQQTRTEPFMIITCDNCGHGVDVRGCPSDPLPHTAGLCQNQQSIHNARAATIHFLKAFLASGGSH
eukprot:TRINITY_DN368_c0_g1_i1.p1 TRINITY_DN368_c0_g1~~TRINITY_DN368_c0_g1_i1.p1  ORF type:complete len:512 (-),score=87.81 TRINITY_DN368_c0_g1_i1:1020-2555(-)